MFLTWIDFSTAREPQAPPRRGDPRKSLGPRGCLGSQRHRWDTAFPGWKTVRLYPTGAFNLSSHTVLKLEARQAQTRVLPTCTVRAPPTPRATTTNSVSRVMGVVLMWLAGCAYFYGRFLD